MHPKAAAILKVFRERSGDHVSGELLSRALDVSRTAIWKHISALRSAGYLIEAVPSRGYCLRSSPDCIDSQSISSAIGGALIGSRLVYADRTASTNSDAFRLAEEGAAEGTAVIAECQTAGKGRMGRAWSSPLGVNIYCSVVLRPAIRPYEAPQLTFLSAVAVARAIESITHLKPRIKWPNDLLIEGRKVAGLLNEMSAETDAINFVILGIGVNLNMTAEQFPADLRTPATSLYLEAGSRVDRNAFVTAMLAELDSLYADFLCHGFEPVRREVEQRCLKPGELLSVSDNGVEMLRGAFAGIDADGALLVKRESGMVERIFSGDVRVL